jgi:ABC transport permease subunit
VGPLGPALAGARWSAAFAARHPRAGRAVHHPPEPCGEARLRRRCSSPSAASVAAARLGHVRSFVRLIGQLTLDLRELVRAPHRAPWRDFSGHLYHIGATALPITALVGLIGVVLAYLTAQQLRQFGADAYIVNILGISLVRELGPMLAAILIAGRSGSAITAQIGVMRVTDELDAMRVMGISHTYRLVMPRAMALAIAMPLISVWTTVAGWRRHGGGRPVAGHQPDLLPEGAARGGAALQPGAGTMTKSVVFGILIALIGCHFGLRVQAQHPEPGRGHDRLGGDLDHGGDPGRCAVRHRSSAAWGSDGPAPLIVHSLTAIRPTRPWWRSAS